MTDNDETPSKKAIRQTLTRNQEMFCWLYANPPPVGAETAVDAYIRAFSFRNSRTTATKCASNLLLSPLVQHRINEIRRANAERSNVTTDRVIAEYARMAFARITDYIRWDAQGKMEVIPSDQLTNDQAAAIREFFGRDNWKGQRVLLHEKIAALDRLAKYLGLFTERIDVTSGGQPMEPLSDADRAARILEILGRSRFQAIGPDDSGASRE